MGNRIQSLLGIEVPIIQAPTIATAAVAAAATARETATPCGAPDGRAARSNCHSRKAPIPNSVVIAASDGMYHTKSTSECIALAARLAEMAAAHRNARCDEWRTKGSADGDPGRHPLVFAT